MDSTVDVLSEQPWGETYFEWHKGFIHSGYRRNCDTTETEFNAQFKIIRDKKQNYWMRGDIVKFSSGYFEWRFEHRYPWKKWFMNTNDYLNALRNDPETFRDKKIPMYARLEYGMVLTRYKWIKDKDYHGKVFQDYGSIIMMLTGAKVGRIRRYYIKCPYEIISPYPYHHIVPFYKTKYGIEEVPQLSVIQEAMKNSNTKDEFIVNMVEYLKEETA